MSIEELEKLAKFLNRKPVYVGFWIDYYYPDNSNNGSTGEYDKPEEAYAQAKAGAKGTGFTNVNYYVTAELGDVVVELDEFNGST